jgi:glycosyltransferase involved in cell wall biosynthesis
MKILHTVEFYKPSTGGAQEVARQISEGLVKRGHQVTVATTKLAERSSIIINGVRIEEFAITGNAVRGCSGEIARYQGFLRAGDFDLMMNYAAQQWSTDLVFPILDELPYRKVLAPCGLSALSEPRYESYFRELPSVLRKYDRLIFHSNSGRDVQFARSHEIDQYSVVPNGASLEEFENPDHSFRARYGIPADRTLLLTVGSHTGAKGHGVTIEAFRRAKIGPATLVVIGNTVGWTRCLTQCRIQAKLTEIATFGKKRVLLLDPPRNDVVSAYDSADLFVFGSKIECSPIVLFEAAASHTPFLSSDCGNTAEIAEWTASGKVLQVTTAHTMAKAMEELLADKPKLQSMAESGFRAWKTRFTWENIAAQYEQLYADLVRCAQIRLR